MVGATFIVACVVMIGFGGAQNASSQEIKVGSKAVQTNGTFEIT